MSRVGKKPITVPNNVQLSFNDGILTVKGPKGTQIVPIADGITFNNENGTLSFQRANDDKKVRALHGLSRALAFNAIEGVSNGFQRSLAIEGVGFKAEMRGKKLLLTLGYSHPILVIPPDGIEFATPTPTSVQVKGISKHDVGEVAAKIRSIRPPEPYKGKGVRYEGEYIRRKAGKSAGK
ncbi:MAG: 50S ribosomal protein L6 [Bacteroidetes bacterium]|nr:50S ribosomal protein L6 [bacterium]NBP63119.1 50S ribosomal protein L6 [Bacteroidota bacterium]